MHSKLLYVFVPVLRGRNKVLCAPAAKIYEEQTQGLHNDSQYRFDTWGIRYIGDCATNEGYRGGVGT